MTARLPLVLMSGSAVALALLGAYSIACDLFLRDRERLNRRIDEAFRRRQRQRAEQAMLFKDLAQAAAGAGGGPVGLRGRFRAMVDQSGLETTPRRVLTTAAVAAAVLGAAAFLLGGAFAALPAAAGAASLPVLRVHLKRQARRERLRAQLPDAFDLMTRVIRSGQTMQQALMAVADEFTPPIAEEFGLCSEQQNLGLSTEEAYRELAERTGLVEIKIFVMGAAVQQQTGGNLSELLDRLATLLRDRAKIRGAVKSLTAEGRLQAALLMGLPPGLYLMMLALNGAYARQLLHYPKVLVATVVLELLGALWIRKIINFDF